MRIAALVLSLCLLAPGGTARAADPTAALAPFLGAPYRDDGVDDPAGRHTLFADQAASFPTAGYNCSGFVTTASRRLLGRPLPLDAARHDRKGDSGPGSPRGQDWDFGYDLLLNITDGLPRRVLPPNAPTSDPAALDASRFRGFPLHDKASFDAALNALRPGEMAVIAFSKERKGRLYYYHVGLIVSDGQGRRFLYHATPGHGVHRLEISSPTGMAAFGREFAEKRFGDKRVLLVAVPLPR
ncbi:conserved hypothetical protein [Solidesulfovibrio fructosivorans JJ]]|uniref:Uncharacterized protein n=1 Tax=Solidesulfovibrio fructosivorans JJ] TaxID=596151 RepID=E1K1V2_SOLFR|nr:hypothetical protein [Solidesulfovibrio fructosivorans]EFL49408.1 conserved hypothetical protein [Solidesulfovibrio fructosivorans JJ]]